MSWTGAPSVIVIALAAIFGGLMILLERPGNFPYLADLIGQRWNNTLHDIGHALTGLAVALGLSWGFAVPDLTAYLVGLVGLPLAQELADYIRFRVITNRWGLPSGDSAHDPMTYQGAWAVPLVGVSVWAAVAVVSLWSAYLAWWNWRR